ncbi:MAG: branched-chain amino acid ABC transporter permease [Spirochaetales bacterium]|nr:branched-chain amino acid ABC transporter permease [Spirochaetales bacterium]
MIEIDWKKELKQSTLAALWFVFLTFPLMVMKVAIIQGDATITWRWHNIPLVAVAFFVLSFVWRQMLERRKYTEKKESRDFLGGLMGERKVSLPVIGVMALLLIAFPFVFSMYQTNIMISVLIYIILGLGLNIVVGYGGLLHLGYAAFYAVGAYSYGMFFTYAGPKFIEWGINTGLMFWISIPVAVVASLIFGFLVCLPVIRLRGDYLAIVTLAFGEITRMFLQNEGWLTQGPSGISQIPRPWLFGMKVTPMIAAKYVYFIALAVVLITIKVVKNLEDSKIGRAWEAMREDDIAAQSMGIDLTKAKLASFAVGALWAGFAGVLLAAKTTFINPESFTLWESIIILCVVVLGGMGSIPGVVVGSLLMIMLPEYFRFFAEYRMLIFGLALVLMMIFRQGGIIPRKRKVYTFSGEGAAL